MPQSAHRNSGAANSQNNRVENVLAKITLAETGRKKLRSKRLPPAASRHVAFWTP